MLILLVNNAKIVNKGFKIPSFKLDENNKESSLKMRKSTSVPQLDSIEEQTQKLPIIEDRYNSSKLNERLSTSLTRIDKNILTIKGKTYKRKDILAIKNYFDSIDTKNKGYITIDDYVKSASKSTHLKRIAVSLFTYLDSTKSGKVNFETMLAKITPGANKDNIKYMLGWIKQEENISKNMNVNIFSGESSD